MLKDGVSEVVDAIESAEKGRGKNGLPSAYVSRDVHAAARRLDVIDRHNWSAFLGCYVVPRGDQ